MLGGPDGRTLLMMAAEWPARWRWATDRPGADRHSTYATRGLPLANGT